MNNVISTVWNLFLRFANRGQTKIASTIQRFGWQVILVYEDDKGPAFAYSIGLYEKFQHPEILIIGLNHTLMHQMINGIGKAVKGRLRYQSGQRYPDLLEGFDCLFETVKPQNYDCYLGQALNHYKGSNFPVLQCIWPDKQGRFPNDPDFYEPWRYLQTLQHSHGFGQGEWPFSEAENTAVFTSNRVLEDKLPILFVSHDEEGDWQMLCGSPIDEVEPRIVCLGCTLKKDGSLGALADLPVGWCATRTAEGQPWKRERL